MGTERYLARRPAFSSHLCRYAGRPAIAESRLSLLPDGRVAYELNRLAGHIWPDATPALLDTDREQGLE